MPKKRHKAGADFVLDASITLAWYFADEPSLYAKSIRKSLSRYAAIAPGLWPLEVANTLVVAERRGRSTEAEAARWLSYLRLLPIRVDNETAARATTDILHVARTHGLSAYDATYLELALRLGLPLASLDDPLNAAARAAGVVAFQP